MAEFAVDAMVSTSTAIEVKIDLAIHVETERSFQQKIKRRLLLRISFFGSVPKKAPFHKRISNPHPLITNRTKFKMDKRSDASRHPLASVQQLYSGQGGAQQWPTQSGPIQRLKLCVRVDHITI